MSKENLLFEDKLNRFSCLEKKHLNGNMIPKWFYVENGVEKVHGEQLYKFHITNEKISNKLFRNLDLKQFKCYPFFP